VTSALHGARVLLVSHEATRTGAPKVAVEIAQALTTAGAVVSTIVRWDGPLRADLTNASSRTRLESFRHLRVAVRKLRPRSWLANRIDEWIAAFTIRRERPDLIYANTAIAAGYVRPARRAGIPVVLHIHELEPLASNTLARYKLGSSYSEITLVACSEAAAANLASIAGVSADDVAVVPSMVNAAQVRETVKDEKTASTEGPRSVVACGTADLRKGVDRWEEAATLVRDLLPDEDIRFTWLGDNTGWPSHAAVDFAGEVANPYPMIASADVFTLPSRVDPFPLVVLEAMALERPVVAFDIEGVREQLGDAGVIVPEGDVGAFAKAIAGLLADHDRRREIGAAAARRVATEFGIERFADLVVAAVARSLATRSPSEPSLDGRSLLFGDGADSVLLLHAFTDDDLEEASQSGVLPYRAERLAEFGITLALTTRDRNRRWRRGLLATALHAVERATVPFLQLLLATNGVRTSTAVVAMFESQGNAMAILRRLHIRPFTKPQFIVITCWLARELEHAHPLRRAFYRWAYQSVDDLIFFSSNQTTLFVDALGMPPSRLHNVPFGVDTEYFSPVPGPTDGYVLAVGRDLGRDWPTFFDAIRGTGIRTLVACRERALPDCGLPENVEWLGVVDRPRYRDLLRQAEVIAVITESRAYPTGQSVLLESMATGSACVATATPALSEYMRPEVDLLTVPVGSALAVRGAIERLLEDEGLRHQLGAEAARRVASDFSSTNMWSAVAAVIRRGESC
jgi:glycosyltransferase involved in cell wall biosynthesis